MMDELDIPKRASEVVAEIEQLLMQNHKPDELDAIVRRAMLDAQKYGIWQYAKANVRQSNATQPLAGG